MKYSPRHTHLSTLVLASVALVSPLFSTTARANLINNGGFEDGVNTVDTMDGQGGVNSSGAEVSRKYADLGAWTTGPNVEPPTVNVLATNDQAYLKLGAGFGTHTGDYVAAFPNFGPPGGYDGYITQIANTVAGKWYTVGFWTSNQLGDYPNNSFKANWEGTDTTTAITGGNTFFGPVQIGVPTGWSYHEFDLQASVSGSRLSFIGGNDAAGNLLDDVTVFDAVPEVSSFGMITGLALLAFGTASRIRRRPLAIA